MPSTSAAAARPMSRPSSSSASRHRKPSPTPSPSPATAPKPKPRPAAAAGSTSARRRSPLSDLNSRDRDASAARERPGCFRFLLSSAASGPARSRSRSRSRSASTPRTPAARPLDPKPRPGAAGARRESRLPDQESRTRAPERRAGQEPPPRRRGAGPEPARGRIGRIEPVAAKKPWLAPRQEQFEALTPERKAADAGSTPEASGSGATPPVHASISPEVAACGGGGSATPTPACFAAGHHVLPGIGDRRKCRPRGILAIAGDGSAPASAADPPRASIRWLSSPSGAEAGTCSTGCGTGEASVNWLVSPRDQEAGVDPLEDDDEILVPRCSLDDAFWRFSPDCTGLLGGLLDFGTPASELSGTTPSSGFLPVQKTPSTGDSISPFSLIVKRASESSQLGSLCAQQRLGSSSSNRNGSVADPAQVSCESWPESVSNGTRSGLTRTSSRRMKVMDPVVECLEMMSLSPRPGDADYAGDGALPPPLPELSFQFAGAPTPFESIDFTSFKRSPRDMEFKGKEASFRRPVMAETRISWREGLVSRMFDMGDLDCCKWLSDDEDAPVLSRYEEALPDDTKFQPGAGPCLQERSGQQEASGFGSVEFSCIGDELNKGRKASSEPVPVAESMWAEGFELVSSDDSDWTLFYKNGLFET